MWAILSEQANSEVKKIREIRKRKLLALGLKKPGLYQNICGGDWD